MISTLLRLALFWLGSAIALPSAEIGEKVASFSLEDTSGKPHSLSDHDGKILILVFWSFKCPVSLAYNDRIAELKKKFASEGVAILGIASNANESQEEIQRNAANLKIPFPILLDSNGAVAEKLGASRTPSVFILDRKGILRYRGAPDNNKNPGGSGRIAYMDEAVESLLAGRPLQTPETREFGCIIQRKGG